ncbi:hypothetical protein [Treponema sp. UBA3813]|uniref:hypothetical protein n=1 Tax=Treponema sp. UBA3813 TaxID=1947715 RepID=UPI0025FC08A9|nr:hypothetical protein [Treponema sp. UBA3813]
MKKIAKITALAVGLFALLFAGCSDISTADATISTTPSSSSDSYKSLTLGVTSSSNLVDFSGSSDDGRTILPTAQQVGNLYFYLCSKNNTAKATAYAAPVNVTVTADTTDTTGRTGTVVINLKKADYDFKLYAVAKGSNTTAPTYATEAAVQLDAVLVGYANADIRTDDKVDFYLTSEGLTKNGSVSLKLYTDGWKLSDYEGYSPSAKITFTKKTTMDSTTYNAGDTYSGSNKDFSATNDPANPLGDSVPSTANYTVTVAPGTYNFEVSFAGSGTGAKTYTWSDRLIVLPGQATEQTIGIPLVIAKKPAAPTDFKAGYIDPTNDTTQYYTAEFVWNGESIDNEEKFVLQLMSLPATVTDTYLTTYNTAVTNASATQTALQSAWDTLSSYAGTGSVKEYSNDFYGDEYVWVAGSLQKNNSMAQFKLLLGSRYVARLCARNDAGDSDWAYATLNTAITADAGTGAVAANKFTSISINRFRVEYDLSGGTLKDKSDADVDTVYYYCQEFKTTSGSTTTGGIEIMDASGKADYTFNVTNATPAVTVEEPKLTLSGSTWTNWLLNNANYNEVNVSPENYGGYESLILVANFATIGTITIHDDANYVIKVADLASTSSGSGTAATFSGTYPVVKMIASQTDDDTLTWTLTYPTGVKYDKVTLLLTSTDGQTHYNLGNITNVTTTGATTTGTFTIPVSEYKKGVYQAVISAWTSIKPQDPYTTNITLTITD